MLFKYFPWWFVNVNLNICSDGVQPSILHALQTSGYVNWAVRSIADAEVQMTAVQRIHEYTTVQQEHKNCKGFINFVLNARLQTRP